MRDTHCVNFEGKCEDVACNACPERQEFGGRFAPNGLTIEDVLEQDVFDQEPRVHNHVEGMLMQAMPKPQGSLDPSDVALFMPDNVMHPPHYARWTMEPIEFIAINNLPWWLANVIKYVQISLRAAKNRLQSKTTATGNWDQKVGKSNKKGKGKNKFFLKKKGRIQNFFSF